MTELSAYAPRYRHVAWAYDAIARAYSLGAIDRAKRAHHGLVQQGDHVLYAGAGCGREIIHACELGAEACCVEPCPAMASRLHRRLSAAADAFTIVPRPIQLVPADPAYDIVVAHFFLNVFDPVAMPGVLGHLCGFVKPGGRLVIADFMPAGEGSGAIDRLIRSLYYRPLSLAGRLLRICALHPIYDYTTLLAGHGFTVESRHAYRVLPGVPGLYEVIVMRRAEAHGAGQTRSE